MPSDEIMSRLMQAHKEPKKPKDYKRSEKYSKPGALGNIDTIRARIMLNSRRCNEIFLESDGKNYENEEWNRLQAENEKLGDRLHELVVAENKRTGNRDYLTGFKTD